MEASELTAAGSESVLERLRARAEETPRSVALIYGDGQVTYQDLARRSDQFALHLVDRGADAGA